MSEPFWRKVSQTPKATVGFGEGIAIKEKPETHFGAAPKHLSRCRPFPSPSQGQEAGLWACSRFRAVISKPRAWPPTAESPLG